MISRIELEQVRHLSAEIQQAQQRLENITSEKGDPQIIARIADEIRINLDRRVAEKERLLQFINGINDSFIRQILTLWCVDNLSWRQVALRMGGNNTADGVRMAYKRYIRGG